MKYRITARTHQGLVRDHNEDNFILNPDQRYQNWYFDANRLYDISESAALWVVADGMGGANAGEVASEMAVMHLKEAFTSFDPKRTDAKEFLQNAVVEANRKIYEASNIDNTKSGMGTTVVAALAVGGMLTVVWVGDSRAYLYRNGKLQPITKDHSFVQQLVDAGKISPEEAFYHPQGNIILQSLGGEPTKVKPDSTTIKLCAGDRVLLCTDGLHGMLQDHVIQDILTQYSGFEDAAHYLIDATLNEGAHDNVTLILAEIVQVQEDSSTDQPSETLSAPHLTVKDKQTYQSKTQQNKTEKKMLPLLVLFSTLVILFAIGILVPWRKLINNGVKNSDSTVVDTTKTALVVDSTDNTTGSTPPSEKPTTINPQKSSEPDLLREPSKTESTSKPTPLPQPLPSDSNLVKDTVVSKPNPITGEKDTSNNKPIPIQKKPEDQDSSNIFESNKKS